uniref:Uncharacterized protein n=1 Tax=Oryza meridionalis TaxID=40149 RepID=A0A0E0C8M8_9ORYZ
MKDLAGSLNTRFAVIAKLKAWIRIKEKKADVLRNLAGESEIEIHTAIFPNAEKIHHRLWVYRVPCTMSCSANVTLTCMLGKVVRLQCLPLAELLTATVAA